MDFLVFCFVYCLPFKIVQVLPLPTVYYIFLVYIYSRYMSNKPSGWIDETPRGKVLGCLVYEFAVIQCWRKTPSSPYIAQYNYIVSCIACHRPLLGT